MTVAIPEKQYFKIGEVSEILDVEPYVLRYWESEFKILKPTRTRARQRLYHKRDLELLMEIKHLLYDEKFTIAGAKKRLQEMKKQSSAEKKAKKPTKTVKTREEPETADFKSDNSPSMDHADYREILMEIKKELKELRSILEG
ncbi:MAG: MerR family transcriptional regulator [Desulfomonile tiedjei]|uniref:MerR family transcriptional regulator n=1 Tax=Desulfomonile tiedjei TaxID=2358 RepID=A0A9D6Z2K3_9BACT|nr:MerR family transcriptional regulator [Desulfomonile tiedjei]